MPSSRSQARSATLAAVAFSLLAVPAGALAAPLGATSAISYLIDADQHTQFATIVGDVNGDGKADQAIESGGRVNVVLGAAVYSPVDLAVGGPRVRAFTGVPFRKVDAAGDFDGDGFDDLITINEAGTTAAVIYGAPGGGGTTTTPTGSQLTTLQTGQLTAPRIAGIGDFNGDGFDDVTVEWDSSSANAATAAIVYGGPRLATLAVNTKNGRNSLIKGARRCSAVLFTQTCVTDSVDIQPVGDFNGDGKDDIYVNPSRSDGRALLLGRSATFTLGSTALGTSGVVRLGARLSPVGATTTASSDLPAVTAGGDVNGDGNDDLLAITKPYGVDATYRTILLGRANPAPQLPATEPVLELGYAGVLDITGPAGDQDGDGRGDLVVITTDPDPGYRVVTHVTDATAPGSIAAIPRLPATPFDGLISPRVGDLDGDGATDLLIIGTSRVVELTRGADHLAPIVRGYRTTLEDASLAPGAGTGLNINSDTDAIAELAIRTPEGALISSETRAVAGDDPTRYPWIPLNNGQPLPPGEYRLAVTVTDAAGNRGSSSVVRTFFITGNAPPTTPTTPSASGTPPTGLNDAAWKTYGSATRASTVVLTPAKTGQVGSAVWPQAVDWSSRTVEFSTTMSGGNGAAEGLTLAFLNANGAFPQAGFLGAGGGRLGFGGLDGTAIALDVFKEATDAQANLVGIAQTTTPSSLNYLAWADAGTRLRAGVVTVKVVSGGGVVTVYVNGSQRIRLPLALPASGYLAFTGSTGASIYQQQEIRSLKVTTSP